LQVDSLKRRAATVSPADLKRHGWAMEQRIAALEAGRDLSRTWIHVDMDAFFASCEELVNPALVGEIRARGA
jgi:DNA polymerase kappa